MDLDAVAIIFRRNMTALATEAAVHRRRRLHPTNTADRGRDLKPPQQQRPIPVR